MTYDLNKRLPGILDNWRDGVGCLSCSRRTKDPITGHDGYCPVPALFTAVAEIKRLRALTEWQPMTSAPRDGTPILVACGKYVYKVHWSDEARFEKFEEKPGWQLFDCQDGFYSIALEPDEPKTWLPLPEPPQETK